MSVEATIMYNKSENYEIINTIRFNSYLAGASQLISMDLIALI